MRQKKLEAHELAWARSGSARLEEPRKPEQARVEPTFMAHSNNELS